MPIYGYKCDTCHKETEAVQSIKDDPLTKCEDCGTETLKRQIGTTSFVLNGSGWAKDNYSSSK